MRISSLLLLVALGPGSVACAQQDPLPGSVTSQLPKNAALVIRFRSIERADAVARAVRKKLAALELELPTLSSLLLGNGVKPGAVDATKPVYFVETDPEAQQTIVLAYRAGGADSATTRDVVRAELREGVLVAGTAEQLQAETRGAPLDTLDGDFVFHIEAGDMIARRKADIDETVAGFRAGFVSVRGVPPAFRNLTMSLVAKLHEAVFAVESVAYALTWKDGNAVAEGRIATKPGTPLRAFLTRAGPPGATNPMVGYLPRDALITFDYVGAGDWPTREFCAFVDAALGAGSATGLGALLDPTVLMAEHLTGRVAGSVRLLGFGAGATSIAELKEGVDAEALLAKIDVDAMNAALKRVDLPITVTLEKAFGRHGETELHRLTLQAADPTVAMVLGATQTFFAVEGRHLFLCVSPTPANDLKALLDRVRAGEPPPHPHAEAMARLGRTHNVGLTFNLGALKPLAMLLGMTAPEAGAMLARLPDELRLSSAFTFADGNIHWRGDWPLEAIADAARRLQEPPQAPEAEKEDEFK
jgi:hypothetical protein